jgi:hypothetical protein
MEFILLAILIGVLLSVSAYLVPYASKGVRQSILLSIFISIVLTPVTLFLLNQNRLVLPQQTEVIEWVSHRWELSSAKERKYAWAKNNFIFIDNSFSNKLVSKPGSNQLGNSTLPIVDRKELALLFQVLSRADSLTDLIICDTYNDIESPDDSLLREILTDKAIQAKMISGYNFHHPNTPFFASLNDSVNGNIVEAGEHNFFSTFQIYREQYPALAYLCYRKMKFLQTSAEGLFVREKKEGRWASFGINSYIPHFELTDEHELYNKSNGGRPGENTSGIANDNNFELGDIVSENGDPVPLLRTLEQRKKLGLKNIVFIGSFKGDETDLHNTFYGRLHGATIHLNLIYSLLRGQHRINFFYLVYMWVFMSLIIYVSIRQALHLPLFRTSPGVAQKIKTKKPGKFKVTILSALKAAWHIIILEELHFWLFAIFVLATASLWGRIINGFVLLIILQLFYKVFRYYALHYPVKSKR